jgi:hypothetical protein
MLFGEYFLEAIYVILLGIEILGDGGILLLVFF